MSKQQRNTRQRRIVLSAVQAHRDHPTADQIYAEVAQEHAKISRGTVYRNLHQLAQGGEIRQVWVPGADRFDYRIEPHCHFRCTQCGWVCDVEVPVRVELDRQVAEMTGLTVMQHMTIFEGLCSDCQQKKAERPEIEPTCQSRSGDEETAREG